MRKLLINIFLLSLSTIIGLGLAEIIVRKAKLSKTWSSYLDGKLILDKKTVYGEGLGYRRTPDSTFTSARDVLFITNELGFREKRLVKGPSRKKRIAFLGDSVTEGFGVEVEDRYSNLIEKHLNSGGDRYETMNFAVAGHSTADQLSVLQNFILDYEPDCIFLQMCFNDFKKNFGDANPSPVSEVKEEDKPFSLLGFLQQNSALYLFVAERYNYRKLQRDVPNSILPTANSIDAEEWKWTVYYLNEIKKICIQNNIQLLLTYVPLEVEVMIKDETKATVVNNKIKSFCESDSILFKDLTIVMRNYDKKSKDKLYLDDCHLSVDGNRLVAEAIDDLFLH